MSQVQRGFTLIEVMITVAIVAILASIAYPSYVEQIAKGKRNECRGALLQTMQQQERYYTQRNTYIAYASSATSAPARTFSGDNANGSACTVSAVSCSGDGSTDIKLCVESRATLTNDSANIGYLYLDSDGRKGCTVNSTRTTTDKKCWP